jgi:hypothetical protein
LETNTTINSNSPNRVPRIRESRFWCGTIPAKTKGTLHRDIQYGIRLFLEAEIQTAREVVDATEEGTEGTDSSEERREEEVTDILTATYIYLALHPITDILIIGGVYLAWRGYKKYITGGRNDTLQTG